MHSERDYPHHRSTPLSMIVTLVVCSIASVVLAAFSDSRRAFALWTLAACCSVIMLFRYARELLSGGSQS